MEARNFPFQKIKADKLILYFKKIKSLCVFFYDEICHAIDGKWDLQDRRSGDKLDLDGRLGDIPCHAQSRPQRHRDMASGVTIGEAVQAPARSSLIAPLSIGIGLGTSGWGWRLPVIPCLVLQPPPSFYSVVRRGLIRQENRLSAPDQGTDQGPNWPLGQLVEII